MIGAKAKGDFIQGLFEYLNSPNGPQSLPGADKLTNASSARWSRFRRMPMRWRRTPASSKTSLNGRKNEKAAFGAAFSI